MYENFTWRNSCEKCSDVQNSSVLFYLYCWITCFILLGEIFELKFNILPINQADEKLDEDYLGLLYEVYCKTQVQPLSWHEKL